MPQVAEDRRAVVDAAVARIRRVAILPEVTLRIVDLIDGGGYEVAEMERLLSTDPAMCLQVLKVVNSAFFGAPKEITSLQRAIVMLGGGAIRNIALATSVGRLLCPGERFKTTLAPELWRHSLAVAAASRALAGSAGSHEADEAFLAGLLHDVGFIVQMQGDHARFTRLISGLQTLGDDSGQTEVDLFGASHQDFGLGLCERWRVPRSLVEVAAWHHAPTACREGALVLRSTVHVADVMSARCQLGFCADVPYQQYDGAALEVLAIGDAELDRIACELPDMTAELERVLT